MGTNRWHKHELAIGKSWAEVVWMVASLMNIGYEPVGDSYTTEDGYICQPMEKTENTNG